MNFYTLSDGTKPTGTAEEANIVTSLTIPNDTKALAVIRNAKLQEFEWGKFYEVEWELNSTQFKGMKVKQKIKCFDEDPKKADRAKQMLVRLFNVVSFKPSHAGAPDSEDLVQLKGKVAGIKVQQWFFNGKEGNWVSGLFPSDKFESEEGVMIQPPVAQRTMPPNCNDSQIPVGYDQLAETTFQDDQIPF